MSTHLFHNTQSIRVESGGGGICIEVARETRDGTEYDSIIISPPEGRSITTADQKVFARAIKKDEVPE